jgi:type 1 glutamine amidotransferase
MPRLFARLLLIAASLASLSPDTSPAAEPQQRARVLLIGQGPDGHPFLTHEYRAAASILANLLKRHPGVQPIVTIADDDWTDGPELLDSADAAVVFVSEGAKWLQASKPRLAAFQALASRGGGLICLHWGMGTKDAENIAEWVKLFGGCHGGPDRRYKVVDVALELADKPHPVLHGVDPITVHEEFYFKLKLTPQIESLTPLIRVNIEDESHTVAWAWQRPDGGRSFGFSGLHFHNNWEHKAYRRLMTQAVLWSLVREIPLDGVDVSISKTLLSVPERDK